MINKVTLVGNLGEDPELRYTVNQLPVCNLSVATKEAWLSKSGEKQEHTEWHRITVWSKQAENCNRYLHKGSLVYIEGKIKTEMYEKDGEKRYTTKIEAQSVKFLSSPKNETRPLPPKPPAGEPDFRASVPNGDDIPF